MNKEIETVDQYLSRMFNGLTAAISPLSLDDKRPSIYYFNKDLDVVFIIDERVYYQAGRGKFWVEMIRQFIPKYISDVYGLSYEDIKKLITPFLNNMFKIQLEKYKFKGGCKMQARYRAVYNKESFSSYIRPSAEQLNGMPASINNDDLKNKLSMSLNWRSVPISLNDTLDFAEWVDSNYVRDDIHEWICKKEGSGFLIKYTTENLYLIYSQRNKCEKQSQ
jgi:hypothetical protein